MILVYPTAIEWFGAFSQNVAHTIRTSSSVVHRPLVGHQFVQCLRPDAAYARVDAFSGAGPRDSHDREADTTSRKIAEESSRCGMRLRLLQTLDHRFAETERCHWRIFVTR